jgi:hypothetical protein
MVGRGVAARGRRHIAEHNIGKTAELGFDGRCDGGVVNIGAQNCGSGYWCGLGEIDPYDGAAAGTLDRDLCLAARRAAEIDDPPAGQ